MTSSLSPQSQLDAFIDKFEPALGRVVRAALARMKKQVPGSFILVYDNFNALAIGFGPSQRASEALFSLAVYPRWVSLFFLNGVTLKDPAGILKGSGNRARHVDLARAADLDSPAVRTLIEQALATSKVAWPNARRSTVIIKSIAARQRPRRPA